MSEEASKARRTPESSAKSPHREDSFVEVPGDSASEATGHASTSRSGSGSVGTVAVLRTADVATRGRIFARLQREQGNAFVQRLVIQLRDAPAHRPSRPGRIQRFASAEHRDLGDTASGHATTDLNVGTATAPDYLTYGQMVALAGDFFESFSQMQGLAGSQPGRDQIRWARWKALGLGTEPTVSDDAKKAVMDRYYSLAAKNVSHFSAGGTARNAYEQNHNDALTEAFGAGLANDPAKLTHAKTIEAFGNHFLTDMFSAGHVRTPRAEMRTWYQSTYPNSIDQFITYLAQHMRSYLVKEHPFGWALGQVPSAAELEQLIRAQGGEALKSFSLGDIVSLAYHDRDNQGLQVVSDVNEAGIAVPGGFKYTAMGDNNLAKSQTTWNMAVAAMQASMADLYAMHSAGLKWNAQLHSSSATAADAAAAYQTALQGLIPFKAEQFIPREDTGAGNVTMTWKWGAFNQDMRNAVDQTVKTEIAQVLRDKAATQSDANKKDAIKELGDHLGSAGITAIEAAIGAKAGP